MHVADVLPHIVLLDRFEFSCVFRYRAPEADDVLVSVGNKMVILDVPLHDLLVPGQHVAAETLEFGVQGELTNQRCISNLVLGS